MLNGMVFFVDNNDVCESLKSYTSIDRSHPVGLFSIHKLIYSVTTHQYRGADKSLARLRKKQARKQVRDASDFNNIETRAEINFFFPARQGAEGNSRHSDRNISLFPSWSG